MSKINKIQVNGVTYDVGGTTVEVDAEPSSSGKTLVATITVDGVAYSLYAPSSPDLGPYATKEELEEYLKSAIAASTYATKTDLKAVNEIALGRSSAIAIIAALTISDVKSDISDHGYQVFDQDKNEITDSVSSGNYDDYFGNGLLNISKKSSSGTIEVKTEMFLFTKDVENKRYTAYSVKRFSTGDIVYTTEKDILDWWFSKSDTSDTDAEFHSFDAETPDLSEYAKKDEIPSLEGYATEEWVAGKDFVQKGDISTLITYTPSQTEGVALGSISVDGTSKTIYAPEQTATPVEAVFSTGTRIGKVESTDLYIPTVNFTQSLSEGVEIGTIQVGDSTKSIFAPSQISLDTEVTLAEDLKTYYNIGKITNASGKTPVVVATKGQTLRDVFDALMKMDEIQPTKTEPAITAVSFSSSADDELGTEITTISYSITATKGLYTYDSSTGVTWENFNFSGGCEEADKAQTSGTITLASTYVVGTSEDVTIDVVGTHTAGATAVTNLGNASDPAVKIAEGTSSISGTFSVSANAYPYVAASSSEDAPTSGTKVSSSLEGTSGTTVAYASGEYLWILSVENDSSKKIQIYSDIAKSWSDMLGGTKEPVAVSFTMANGKTRTYYAYRTENVAQSGGTALIRLN